MAYILAQAYFTFIYQPRARFLLQGTSAVCVHLENEAARSSACHHHGAFMWHWWTPLQLKEKENTEEA